MLTELKCIILAPSYKLGDIYDPFIGVLTKSFETETLIMILNNKKFVQEVDYRSNSKTLTCFPLTK